MIEFLPQRRRERRETIYCLAGDTAKQKEFRPFNANLIHRCHNHQEASPFFPKACLPAGRCGSAVSLILKDAHVNQKVQ
jgi:hypothetical protein